ncbi:MAG: hypothetical protein NTY02_06045 [Acidobacteria bacterium]|nr:hypothetical protein [Acidobacteriota bacterium]
MRNLEIKAAVRSFEACRSGLRAQPEARRHAILRQTDWYFRVPRGRMKLREIVESGTRTAELIVSLRPATRAARTSEFVRLPVVECVPTRRMLP